MVEYGIVKFFNRKDADEGGQYGFIFVTDENGEKTGEEIYFHRRQQSPVRLGTINIEPYLGKPLKYRQTSIRPMGSDQVVFERVLNSRGRSRVHRWNYAEAWQRVEVLLTERRDIDWRIVLKGIENTGKFIHFANTVDEKSRKELISVTCSGRRFGSIREARSWTNSDLDFIDPDDYDRQGYDEYEYYLQVRLHDGKWLQIKAITPLPPLRNDDEEDYPYDDEPDEDPLAGDVDPTGGYPEPEVGAFDAHQLEVMRQHGDYTG